ncbi:Phosphorelay intermediate protein [Coemansia sp. RSA 1813]|nr:Phosphorelay intermediate protein [Coemansia sp. RSA 1646]KAJ1772147.1 Phosphorelay intermediate protein [Coemansia sp. RSA 1843]KAJ2091734.1 Phosphorelay intermediate protein [Coemansia sp. RSA 986]KAJ2216862.1 Phosphorelay intermediate protein [Coemansia sp. RSA 487]KAJ2571864.1 Phosphorelay intermediate protein [Coemansia sp. RSA 1813]
MSSGGNSDPTEQDDEFLDNDILDLDVFNQLLSMDDANDDEYEFSQDIVYDYFEQAKTTFADMDKALSAKDLAKLSTLGHFLKGSSATIGVKKVQDACKHIQYLGKLQGMNGEGSVDKDEALRLIGQELKNGKAEFKKAEEFLHFFYDSSG